MRFITKSILFIFALATLLLSNCAHMASSDQKTEELSLEDRVVIESILSSLKSMTGEFERVAGPLVQTGGGFTRVDIDRFSGERSFFVRLGDIIDKHPSIAHQVISTLVGSLDDMTPTKVIYRGKAVPLGVMCYEALHGICYYEATDKDGNITAWVGTVVLGATEVDLKIAKKAWKKIVKERAYIML